MRMAVSTLLTFCPPPAPGAERINPEVLVSITTCNIIVQLGIDKHGGEDVWRRLFGVKRGDPHQAMHAGFGFQIAIGVGPLTDNVALLMPASSPASKSRVSTLNPFVPPIAHTCGAAFAPSPETPGATGARGGWQRSRCSHPVRPRATVRCETGRRIFRTGRVRPSAPAPTRRPLIPALIPAAPRCRFLASVSRHRESSRSNAALRRLTLAAACVSFQKSGWEVLSSGCR